MRIALFFENDMFCCIDDSVEDKYLKSNEYTDPDLSANDNNAIGVSTLTTSPPTRYLGGSISLTF